MQYVYEIIDALDEYYKDDRQLKLNILEELYKTTKDEGFFLTASKSVAKFMIFVRAVIQIMSRTSISAVKCWR